MLNLVSRLWRDRRVRYLAAGGLSIVTNYAIFSGVWLLAHATLPYLLVVVIANTVTAGLVFGVYRRFIFDATGPRLASFLRFYAVWSFGLVANLIGLPLLVELAHVPVLLAQALVIVTVPVLNYQLHLLWTFRRRTTTQEREVVVAAVTDSPGRSR